MSADGGNQCAFQSTRGKRRCLPVPASLVSPHTHKIESARSPRELCVLPRALKVLDQAFRCPEVPGGACRGAHCSAWFTRCWN